MKVGLSGSSFHNRVVGKYPEVSSAVSDSEPVEMSPGVPPLDPGNFLQRVSIIRGNAQEGTGQSR